MPSSPSQWLEFLYEALHSEFGVVVVTNQPVQARAALSAARAGDPALKGISICTSRTNPNGELWLVKKQEQADG